MARSSSGKRSEGRGRRPTIGVGTTTTVTGVTKGKPITDEVPILTIREKRRPNRARQRRKQAANALIQSEIELAQTTPAAKRVKVGSRVSALPCGERIMILCEYGALGLAPADVSAEWLQVLREQPETPLEGLVTTARRGSASLRVRLAGEAATAQLPVAAVAGSR